MIKLLLRAPALRTAALGALALLVGSFSMTSVAGAAFVQDVDLGNISVRTETWNPSTDSVVLGLWFNRQNQPGISGFNVTRDGEVKWDDASARGSEYTVNYNFSLYHGGTLTMNGPGFQVGPFSAYQTLTLTGPDGKVVFHNPELASTWNQNRFPTLSQLQGGDYVLSISGKAPTLGTAYFYMSLNADGGSALPPSQPGDVPLPGALLLLGTALAGAGLYGRKKLGARKEA